MRGKLFTTNNVEFLPRQGSEKIPPYARYKQPRVLCMGAGTGNLVDVEMPRLWYWNIYPSCIYTILTRIFIETLGTGRIGEGIRKSHHQPTMITLMTEPFVHPLHQMMHHFLKSKQRKWPQSKDGDDHVSWRKFWELLMEKWALQKDIFLSVECRNKLDGSKPYDGVKL